VHIHEKIDALVGGPSAFEPAAGFFLAVEVHFKHLDFLFFQGLDLYPVKIPVDSVELGRQELDGFNSGVGAEEFSGFLSNPVG